MIAIRLFEERDNSYLLEIEKHCPQGDEKCALGVDKKGDILARYKMYDNWKVLVAEEGGKVAGWIGWTIKEDPFRKSKYAYLVEVVVHPEFRRKGIAKQLINEAEKNAKDSGSDHIYCYIYDPNHASKTLFKRSGYSDMASVQQCAISTHKKSDLAQEFSIENPKKEEIQKVVRLINDYNKEHMHFEPFTAESFMAFLDRIPDYGKDNFWVAKKEEEIVACAGLWDSSKLADLYYAKEPSTMKAMRCIFGFLGPLVKMPKIPAEGERFKFQMMTNYAFNPKSSDAILNLIRSLGNMVLDAKSNYLLVVIDSKDPLFDIVKSLNPLIEIWRIYARSLNGEMSKFGPFYADARDLIP